MERDTSGEETTATAARRDELRQTLGRLSRTGELPTLPSVATTALSIARDPDANVDQLCRAVQTDVGIAARILRVANSAIYGRRTVCKNLRDAVTTLGMRTMQDVLSAAALRSVLDLRNPVAQRLWDHALAVGIAAEEIGRATRAVRPGGAFIPGLFHDVGRIVFYLGDPTGYDAVVENETNAANELEIGHFEREWYGFDHNEAGAVLATDWGLPAEFCDAIRWHHAPAKAPTNERLARLVATADYLAYRMELGASNGAPERRAAQVHALPLDDEEELIARVREAFTAERGQFE